MHIQASWGGFELVDIAKELFRAALTDTANQKMVLLSESCLPLYPATLTYAQLISEPKSRINACHDWVRCLQISSHDAVITHAACMMSEVLIGCCPATLNILCRETAFEGSLCLSLTLQCMGSVHQVALDNFS